MGLEALILDVWPFASRQGGQLGMFTCQFPSDGQGRESLELPGFPREAQESRLLYELFQF